MATSRRLGLAALHRWRTTRDFADAIIGRTLSGSDLETSDRAFVQELFYGVLRNLSLLDYWISRLRRDNLEHETRDILRLGIYQLLLLRLPEHAAVFETVELAPLRSRGLINAVLRNAIREREQLHAAAAAAPLHVRESHPPFLVTRWCSRFGEEATKALCRWNNQPPPIYARINTVRLTRDEFLHLYPDTQSCAQNPLFVRAPAVPLVALERGDCYVQDPSTAFPVDLLEPQPGETILDACAAPGGKTAYIAALAGNAASIVACDRDAARLDLLRRNLTNLSVTVELIQHDWSTGIPSGLRTRRFDRILLDAPCSNTGVIRRRVDVRWRIRPSDSARMAAQQFAIARALIPLLKPGGVFVYSTCSIEPEENEAVAERVQTEFPDLKLDMIKSLLPFRDGVDGSFAARFTAS